MDYNKKGVKWYWWTLLVVYTAGAIYALLTSNPYLYSQVEFQQALVGRKSNTPLRVVMSGAEKAAPEVHLSPLSLTLWGRDRKGVDPAEVTRNRRFVEESSSQIQWPKSFEPKVWSSDEKGLVFVGGDGEVLAVDWEGFPVWRFSAEKNLDFLRPTLLAQQVLLVSQQGHIYSLSRDKGELQWYSHFAQEIFSPAMIIQNKMYLAIRPWTREIKVNSQIVSGQDEFKEDLSPGIAELDVHTGEWLRISAPLNLEQKVHWSSNSKSLYLSHDRSLIEIDLTDLKQKRKKDFEAEIISPVMLIEKNIVVPTRDGRVFGLRYDMDLDYESDMGYPIVTPPVFIPIFERLAMVTDNGYLQVVGAESGERRWRFNLQNESPSSLGWSSRLNGKHIEELNLGWRYKGWSLWVPCVKDRVCIYNPDQGQIIGRIMLSGAYTSPPYVDKKTFYFVLKENSQWKISKYIERVLAGKDESN